MNPCEKAFWASPATLLAALKSLGVHAKRLCDDSRQVQAGDLFLAYPGDFSDGRNFIAEVIEKGACAILWEDGTAEAAHKAKQTSNNFVWNPVWKIPNLPVAGLRRYCGPLAHAIFGQPSERLSLIAITGTNGKTTISHWIGQTHPRHAAIVGTLGAGFHGKLSEGRLTTPGAVELTRLFAEFVDAEAHACALEASSIGIAEGRLDGARIDVAIFTNLTRDHLDYHGSMENYAAAKEKLFNWPHLRLAIVNLDDPFGVELAARTCASKIIGYSQNEAMTNRQGVVCAESVEESREGLRFKLCTPKGRARVETNLIGRFNVSNLLALAALLIDAGLSPKDVASRLAKVKPPPGRLEKIGGEKEPLLVVDYAHTPDALQNTLLALRGVAEARQARLTVVFGCGGGRDPGKRPQMGQIAASLADNVILTNDNPRNESPESIIEAIRVGAPNATIIADRGDAILHAVLEADPSDVILVAGKGHETYQEILGVRTPFSDLDAGHAALTTRRERLL